MLKSNLTKLENTQFIKTVWYHLVITTKAIIREIRHLLLSEEQQGKLAIVMLIFGLLMIVLH